MRPSSGRRLQTRLFLVTLAFLGWTAGLVLRCLQLQVLRHRYSRAEVYEHSRDIHTILPKRGIITDRNGGILAENIPAQSLFLSPSRDESEQELMSKVQSVRDLLGLSEKEIHSIQKRIIRKERFIYLKRKVEKETAEKVKALGLSGIFSHEESLRFYPHQSLAGHILGGVNVDGQGAAGVEYQFNDYLAGIPGKALVLRDARRRPYRMEIIQPAVDGRNLVLTIDGTLQYFTERELQNAVTALNASWGTAILCHPRTGEILALANVPGYDPNVYPPRNVEAGINRGIHVNFEPGSTFKIVTAATALEKNLVGFDEVFDCREGAVNIPGPPIRDHKPFDILTFPQVFIHSSNIGAVQIGQRVGPASLEAEIRAFGFGQKTGIKLPGEQRGIFHPLSQWNRRTLFAVSIGYEVSATALQILQAANIIANRGISLPPRIVRHGGRQEESLSSPPVRVLSETTAARLASIMEKVVEEGTGKEARIEGYAVAGKTGTTQKFDPETGSYSSSKHIASFVGFVPVDNPVLSLVVVIDEPKRGLYYGGQAAAPVFREITRKALRHLDVFPRKKEESVLTAQFLREEGRE